MSGGISLVASIYYGFDLNSFYLRMDFTETEEPRDLSPYRVSVLMENTERYRVDVDLGKPDAFTIYRQSKDKWVRRSRRNEIAVDRIFEMGILFRDIGVTAGERINFVVTVYENDVECERWPVTGNISFLVPDENFESMMWQV